MKILVIDNYDSFTYNLVYLLRDIDSLNKVTVWRNDSFNLEDVKDFDKILISPGPGIPRESGLILATIKEYCQNKSILGICLGHQAIGEAFGAELINLKEVFHGVQTEIYIKEKEVTKSLDLFQGLQSPFMAGRYHSWVIDPKKFPESELEISCIDKNNYIMGVNHKKWDVQGIQFHPESIMTNLGSTIIKNWLNNKK